MSTDAPTDLTANDIPSLACPKCKCPMEKVTYENIQVDRCTGCQGLWFDMLEREHLQALTDSGSIDIGVPRQESREEVVRINCPVDHAQMIRMVDRGNAHVWYESCPVCFGVFFDAGEFRQVKEPWVMRFFSGLLDRKERH